MRGSVGLDSERKRSWWCECRGAKRLARRELVGWRRDGYGIWWEIPWHETSLLDQSVPDVCADVQYCTRIRRGFVPGRVPLVTCACEPSRNKETPEDAM